MLKIKCGLLTVSSLTSGEVRENSIKIRKKNMLKCPFTIVTCQWLPFKIHTALKMAQSLT